MEITRVVDHQMAIAREQMKYEPLRLSAIADFPMQIIRHAQDLRRLLDYHEGFVVDPDQSILDMMRYHESEILRCFRMTFGHDMIEYPETKDGP